MVLRVVVIVVRDGGCGRCLWQWVLMVEGCGLRGKRRVLVVVGEW